MEVFSKLLAALALGVVFVAYKWAESWQKAKTYNFPTPVPGIPFFGNTFQLPVIQQGHWGRAMKDKYGEMFTCKIGGNKWVFLSSSRVVEALLERRSAIYSSRIEMPMASGLLSGNRRVVLMQYGEQWRKIRKYLHQILNTRAKNPYKAFQELESTQLLHEYLHSPDTWFKSNERFSNSIIMSVIFGRRADLEDKGAQDLFESVGEIIDNLQPGYNLVDGFPVLAKLPKFLQWWRPRGELGYRKTIGHYQNEVDRLHENMKNGTAKPCFAIDFLEATEKSDMEHEQKLFTLGTLMEGGSDTTRIVTSQIVAAAATYPDWVVRVRVQLDAVCGANAERLPTYDDRPQLPLVSAATKEGLRWRPLVEIGLPHVLIQDDEFEGYRFPAGTVFTWNAQAIALDPNEYEEPLRFWPERFMNEDLNNPLKGHWGYGAGRRVCAGWQVGDETVWIAVARLIYCFDFTEDPNRPIDTLTTPWQEHDKPPFHVKITPRSPQHAELIERSFATAFPK